MPTRPIPSRPPLRVFGQRGIVEKIAETNGGTIGRQGSDPVESVPAPGVPGVTTPPGPPPYIPPSRVDETVPLRARIKALQEEMAPLRAELEPLRAERDLYKRRFEAVTFAEGPFGIVIKRTGHRAVVHVGARQFMTVTIPDGTDTEIGDAVRFAKTDKGFALVESLKQPLEACPIVIVAGVLPHRRFECTSGGVARTCRYGRLDKVAAGDRVIVDPDVQLALVNLGPVAVTQSTPESVEWDDIGGLEHVKQELREAIEDPIVHRDLYKAFKLKPPRGILLTGAVKHSLREPQQLRSQSSTAVKRPGSSRSRARRRSSTNLSARARRRSGEFLMRAERTTKSTAIQRSCSSMSAKRSYSSVGTARGTDFRAPSSLRS